MCVCQCDFMKCLWQVLPRQCRTQAPCCTHNPHARVDSLTYVQSTQANKASHATSEPIAVQQAEGTLTVV